MVLEEPADDDVHGAAGERQQRQLARGQPKEDLLEDVHALGTEGERRGEEGFLWDRIDGGGGEELLKLLQSREKDFIRIDKLSKKSHQSKLVITLDYVLSRF